MPSVKVCKGATHCRGGGDFETKIFVTVDDSATSSAGSGTASGTASAFGISSFADLVMA